MLQRQNPPHSHELYCVKPFNLTNLLTLYEADKCEVTSIYKGENEKRPKIQFEFSFMPNFRKFLGLVKAGRLSHTYAH